MLVTVTICNSLCAIMITVSKVRLNYATNACDTYKEIKKCHFEIKRLIEKKITHRREDCVTCVRGESCEVPSFRAIGHLHKSLSQRHVILTMLVYRSRHAVSAGHWSLTQTLTIDYPLAGTRPQGRKSLTCAATRTESCPDRQIISYSDNFPDLRLYLRPYVTIAPASQSDSVNQTSRVTTSDHRHLHLRRTRPQGRKSLTCAATRTESCPERQIIS